MSWAKFSFNKSGKEETGPALLTTQMWWSIESSKDYPGVYTAKDITKLFLRHTIPHLPSEFWIYFLWIYVLVIVIFSNLKFFYRVNLSKRVGKDGFFLGLEGLLIGISLGFCPREIFQSSPVSYWKTLSFPPLSLRFILYF